VRERRWLERLRADRQLHRLHRTGGAVWLGARAVVKLLALRLDRRSVLAVREARRTRLVVSHARAVRRARLARSLWATDAGCGAVAQWAAVCGASSSCCWSPPSRLAPC